MAQQVTNLGLAVLELLIERPMHPYEMHRTMRMRHTDRVVKLKGGSLYHTVERLERLGMVQAAETVRAGRRPERTTYRITDAGRELYAAQVPELIAAVVDEYPALPAGLALGNDLGREPMLEALRRRRVELEHLVQENLSGRMHVTRIGLPERFWLDLRYALAMRRAELTFVLELIDDIERDRLSWDQPAPSVERFGDAESGHTRSEHDANEPADDRGTH